MLFMVIIIVGIVTFGVIDNNRMNRVKHEFYKKTGVWY